MPRKIPLLGLFNVGAPAKERFERRSDAAQHRKLDRAVDGLRIDNRALATQWLRRLHRAGGDGPDAALAAMRDRSEQSTALLPFLAKLMP